MHRDLDRRSLVRILSDRLSTFGIVIACLRAMLPTNYTGHGSHSRDQTCDHKTRRGPRPQDHVALPGRLGGRRLGGAGGIPICGRYVADRSREKAVLGNFRQLGAAVDQYYLEFSHRFFVAYGDIVGPGRYIKSQNRILGEDYSVLFPLDRHRRNFFQTVRLSNGLEVTDTYEKVEPPHPPDGVHSESGPGGEKYETTWRGGVRHGRFRAWRADGTLWSEANFVEGRVDGPCWLYLPDGSRIDELNPASHPATMARP